MAKLFGAQRLVLQAIQDSPKDAAGFVTDTQVAHSTKIAVKDVSNWIETLEGVSLGIIDRWAWVVHRGASQGLEARCGEQRRGYDQLAVRLYR
jgi:hypothetical protein